VSGLSIDDFPRAFTSIHGQPPFEWQKRLLREIDEKGWPNCVAAPTGAGKTAVLDIALFHLALELSRGTRPRRAPTRIVFAVDRRLIVDQAFERAKKIGTRLNDPEDDLLKRLGAALGAPLHVEEIRGGIPREDDWARTPAQPTILCTTVDQLGSRLLFRGYGVSESMAPVHAGLLGQDALILLDEAHLSAAFEQTLRFLSSRRNPAKPPSTDLAIVAPWAVCTLTATPRDHVGPVFELDAHERTEESIAQRLRAAKNVEFNEVEGTLGSSGHAQAFVDAAERLTNPGETIAVVVNRVKLARAIRERLAQRHHAILLTGRVRPLERDRLIEEYRSRLFSGLRLESEEAPLFVVATQCIEAGADFDFGGMVTQIAPLDCLRQRFGRLDRLGKRGRSAGVVIATRDEVAKSAKPDPIYDDRARKTWEWLVSKAPEPARGENKRLDFGPEATGELIAHDPEGARACAAAAKSAPVLRAADVTFLTMTHPRPHPDPHLPLFLHGDPRVEADVAIVWRADLPDPPDVTAKVIVAYLPPKAAEALAVPLWEARQWLTGGAQGDVSDVEGAEPGIRAERQPGREALRWRGAETRKPDLSRQGSFGPAIPSSFRRNMADVTGSAGPPRAKTRSRTSATRRRRLTKRAARSCACTQSFGLLSTRRGERSRDCWRTMRRGLPRHWSMRLWSS
jgi:CRISPR-associated endonuclease/helicase Cas3